MLYADKGLTDAQQAQRHMAAGQRGDLDWREMIRPKRSLR